jgi:hypothetical protein
MDGYTGQVCDVSGFDHEVENREIRIGTRLTVFEDPETGKPRLLQVDQGLDLTEILDHTLANPNQSRVFGINRIPVTAPILAPNLGSPFLKGRLSLKN